MKTVRAKFTLDGDRHFEGVHNPAVRWNGFACPSFKMEVVREISEYLRDEDSQMTEIVKISDGKVFVADKVLDGVSDEYEVVPVDGHYGIGSHGWIWSEVSITEADRVMIAPDGAKLLVRIDGVVAGKLERNSYGDWVGYLEAKIPQADMQTYGLQIESARNQSEVLGQVQDFIWGNFEDL